MKIKIFNTNQESEVNQFIDDNVLTDEGAIQVTADGKVVIFYRASKENYNQAFIIEMLEGLKRNLYHEEVRQVVINAEYEQAKEKGTSYPNFDDLAKKKNECEEQIKKFNTKIEALETWSKKNI